MKKSQRDIVNPGRYYEWTDGDHLTEAKSGVPDVVICRRLSDYTDPLSASARIGECVSCTAPVVFNPDGPHQDRPRVCMQCAGIQPLPFGES